MKRSSTKMTLIGLALLALCAGCGTTYTHPTKPSSQFARDESDCKAWAEKEAARKAKLGQSCVVCDEIDRCLRDQKGWKVVN